MRKNIKKDDEESINYNIIILNFSHLIDNKRI